MKISFLGGAPFGDEFIENEIKLRVNDIIDIDDEIAQRWLTLWPSCFKRVDKEERHMEKPSHDRQIKKSKTRALVAFFVLLMFATQAHAWSLITTQEAVQPFTWMQYRETTVADSATITFTKSLHGLTFTTTLNAELRLWTRDGVTSRMKIFAGEIFDFPDLGIDSVRVYADSTMIRCWGWRRD